MKSPFFIVGCGRSGTTFLRTMLNHHKNLGIPLESLFILDYFGTQTSLETQKKLIVEEYELKEWGLKLTTNDLVDCSTTKEMITRLHERYVEKEGKKRWGQKTPRFVRSGCLLKKHYSQAKFIHIVRDPRAVVSSLKRSEVHRTSTQNGIARWMNDVTHGKALKKAYPDEVLEVRYEDLVTNPEDTLKQVCTFLDEPYDKGMLTYYQDQNEYGEYYERIHAKLSRPPDPSSIARWKQELTQNDVRLIEHQCKPLMDVYHYRKLTSKPAVTHPFHEPLLFLPTLKKANHYMTKRRGYLKSFIKRKIILGYWKDLPRCVSGKF